tara:strand:+ start:388 stop:753 length:366 start_codon:yes stop_codon:yes gene_type:complete
MAKVGLKKGQVHSGSFKKGADPRRHVGGPWAKEKQSFQAMCQGYTDDALQTLSEAVTSDSVGWKDRLAAAELLLSHAHGSPVSRLQVAQMDAGNIGTGSDPAKLSNAQLLRLQDKLNDEPI